MNKRLKILQLIDSVEHESTPLKIFIHATDTEIYLSSPYRSTLELNNIPYREIEHREKPYLAVSRDIFKYKDETNPMLGGSFTFYPDKPVFLVDR